MAGEKKTSFWFNPIMAWLIRSPFHSFVSKSMMVMTFKGAKSGKTFSTPMNYIEDGEGLWTVSWRERKWWRNLRGGAPVTLRLRGKDVPAQAQTIEGETEVAEGLEIIFQKAPSLAKSLQVRPGGSGGYNPEDLALLAQKTVLVQTRLQ